jgi:hypothetical protein
MICVVRMSWEQPDAGNAFVTDLVIRQIEFKLSKLPI